MNIETIAAGLADLETAARNLAAAHALAQTPVHADPTRPPGYAAGYRAAITDLRAALGLPGTSPEAP